LIAPDLAAGRQETGGRSRILTRAQMCCLVRPCGVTDLICPLTLVMLGFILEPKRALMHCGGATGKDRRGACWSGRDESKCGPEPPASDHRGRNIREDGRRAGSGPHPPGLTASGCCGIVSRAGQARCPGQAGPGSSPAPRVAVCSMVACAAGAGGSSAQADGGNRARRRGNAGSGRRHPPDAPVREGHRGSGRGFQFGNLAFLDSKGEVCDGGGCS